MARTLLVLVLLLAVGCSWLRPQPTPILPPEELYQLGESELEKKRYPEAREHFRKVVERHPNSSYAPRARFLLGETFYREAEFDKAVKEFEAFLAFYPRHQIADLVQFRLAMSYYDQFKPIEQEQAFAQKAHDQFKKLVKDYPESRYATDALAKIEVCRGRLAQKEVWVAAYYLNQGNPGGARQRLEKVIKDYPRAPVMPEALWLLADVNFSEGRDKEAVDLLRQVANDYSYTEWGKRAAQRLRAQR
ncbi:MAG TPA: outer membrane protein assembly factor BamD [Methylomirabilota bacterium]|jgi:outer membrane protein assembly factor BamD|nr:outer membrane protein assembly factor BamD [Methylomirabilota bacterium]